VRFAAWRARLEPTDSRAQRDRPVPGAQQDFYFQNGGYPDVYLGSADWMPRNLYERVEVMFPVKDVGLRERVAEILMNYLKDTGKSRVLHADGSYVRAFPAHGLRGRNGHRFNVQDFFVEHPNPDFEGITETPRKLLPSNAA
jgi:polyphosphate kinase